MLPQGVLSTPRAVGSAFLPPRNITKRPLVDYELGGTAIQDPAQGLRVQIWTGQIVGSDVVLSAPSVAPVIVFTQAGITEFQFTFDQNMNPFIAYLVDGESPRFRWFDPNVSSFVVTTLPSGSYSLRCSMDDKRAPEIATSDVILTYLRAGTLYYRQQRDRYLIEYTLKAGYGNHVIGAFGMSRVFRLQWQIVSVLPNPDPEATSIAPTSATEGDGALTLTVTGTGFTVGSLVRFNGTSRPTTFLSPTTLQATISAADLLTPGVYPVTVFNPLPGGGTSSSVNFTVIGTYLRLTEAGDVRITEAGDSRVTQEAP